MAEIRSLNQRGGRMLSIVDLIARSTLSIDLAAKLLVKILDGASFLCCALQGGVGKTALMGALLGLIPPNEEIVTVPSEAAINTLRCEVHGSKRRCLVAHEIGSGSWYGYLWGQPVLDYLALKSQSTRIASNIHADTIDQVAAQVRSFGGTDASLLAFDLILFIALGSGNVDGERSRVVSKVYEAVGEPGCRTFRAIDVAKEEVGARRQARDFLAGLLEGGITAIEDVNNRIGQVFARTDNTGRS